ncbi:hypothetical protein QAD02_012191 [Eretmocerus hayati]|uniref:Uncharacterized protein n=1 Tax=Eretmocerus hayati TaxID=131215 RepID=A0ACC2NYS8_9HYME|nr:hypothetical protein QAD02_012191 [Eretmocerus hayati]
MPKVYQQLALHNSVCNEFYYRLQDCQEQNHFGKKFFLGACNKAEKELDKCIKANSKSDKKSSDQKSHDSGSDDEDNLKYEPAEPGFTYPIEMDSSDMLDEVDGFVDGVWPSPSERYFTPYYAINVQKPGDDVCIRVHSNRICMISLAPSHTIFQENKKIVTCSFKVSEKLDRSQNKVSGKAKHGAQPLQNNSNLCRLICDDGSSYMVKCCMIGKLIEVNLRLMENPELLKLEPELGGYIALALPNLKHFEKIKKSLLTKEQYKEAMEKRREGNDKKESENKQEPELMEVSKSVFENQSIPNGSSKNCEDTSNNVVSVEKNGQVEPIEIMTSEDESMQMMAT